MRLGLAVVLLWLPAVALSAENKVHLTILHLNDVYEITPVSGGKEGGLARVATLRKQLLAKNPNTITTLGGDFFNPSALGTASYQGDKLAGKQMVAVLNALGVDYVTFGNHEFDIKQSQFEQRMLEGEYSWVSSNVFAANGQPYPNVVPNLVFPVADARSGQRFKLGLFGVTLPVNKPDYVRYSDPLTSAGEQVKSLAQRSDFILALTHQSLADDEKMVAQYPVINLVLGGHEHENYQQWRGPFTPILKADGNARSVYVVDIYFDTETGKADIKPQLVKINDTIPDDAEVKAVVDKWQQIAFDAFRQEGFQPEQVLTTLKQPLDGLEAHVRTGSTNLTELIAQSMLDAYPEAELAMFNSGSIRIDDVLPAGEITVYDVIRILPFGGKVQLAQIKGSVLKQALATRENSVGSGGFIQTAHISSESGQWLLNGKAINDEQVYQVAINDFLASGREQKLSFLNSSNPDFKVIKTGENNDIRKLLSQALVKM